VLARYLDDLNVQVLDGSAEDPVVLLCPHLIHRVAVQHVPVTAGADSEVAASIVDVDASVVHAYTHIASLRRSCS
jgi:hypothetical protein